MGRYAKDAIALAAGAMLPLALAPFHIWPLALLAPLLLYHATRSGSVAQVMRRVYLYNLALFGVGASWIYVSVNVYGGASPPLAAALVALLVVSYSLTCLLHGYLLGKLASSEWLQAGARVRPLAFAGLWVLQEWLRVWFLTGFPWLYVGYAFLGTSLEGYAPLLGVFGVSLAAVLIATLLYEGARRRGLTGTALAFATLLIVGAGEGLRRIPFTEPQGEITVSLVQANIDQHSKWLPSSRKPIIDAHLALTEEEFGRDLVVWSEAAITLLRGYARPVLDDIEARAQGSTVVLGIPDRNEEGRFQNTLVAVGAGQGQYIKRRLVPFGEYVPLERWVRGIVTVLDLPMSRNRPGPARQAPLIAGDLVLSASICYEVVYPDLVRNAVNGPDLLVTASNDTWFGASIGPWQHLQMAQMRALENGRTLLRATNNGVTAIVDHTGKLTATLPQFQAGVLRGEAEIRGGTTPFHRLGSLPVILLALLLALSPAAFGLASRIR